MLSNEIICICILRDRPPLTTALFIGNLRDERVQVTTNERTNKQRLAYITTFGTRNVRSLSKRGKRQELSREFYSYNIPIILSIFNYI